MEGLGMPCRGDMSGVREGREPAVAGASFGKEALVVTHRLPAAPCRRRPRPKRSVRYRFAPDGVGSYRTYPVLAALSELLLIGIAALALVLATWFLLRGHVLPGAILALTGLSRVVR